MKVFFNNKNTTPYTFEINTVIQSCKIQHFVIENQTNAFSTFHYRNLCHKSVDLSKLVLVTTGFVSKYKSATSAFRYKSRLIQANLQLPWLPSNFFISISHMSVVIFVSIHLKLYGYVYGLIFLSVLHLARKNIKTINPY